MKKIIFLTITILASLYTLNAQPRSIGARLGYGAEISYQHYFNGNFLEADLGTAGFKSITLHALYDWIIATPVWTTKGDWAFYGGVGLGTGYYNYEKDETVEGILETREHRYGFLGVAGQIGLEYTFWFPLQISVDLRPVIGPKFGDGGGLFNEYKSFFIPFISVRYMF